MKINNSKKLSKKFEQTPQKNIYICNMTNKHIKRCLT